MPRAGLGARGRGGAGARGGRRRGAGLSPLLSAGPGARGGGGGRRRVRPAQGARGAGRRPRRGPLRACPRGAAGPFCPPPRSRPFRAARATRRQKLEFLSRSKAQRHAEVSSPEPDKRRRKREKSELGPNLQPALRKRSCKSLSTWWYEHTTHFDRLSLTHSRLAATASSDCLLLCSPVLRKERIVRN